MQPYYSPQPKQRRWNAPAGTRPAQQQQPAPQPAAVQPAAQQQPAAPTPHRVVGSPYGVDQGGMFQGFGDAYAPGGIPKGGFHSPGPGYAPAPFRDAKGRVRDVGNYAANLVFSSGPAYLQAIQRLAEQAGQSQMSDPMRAAYLGPRQEAISNAYTSARGELMRNLADRGLDQSTAAIGGEAALGGRQANAQAGLIADLYRQEDERQRQAQQQLLETLGSLFGSQQNAALGTGLNLLQLKQQGKKGGGITEILGTLGQLAATAAAF